VFKKGDFFFICNKYQLLLAIPW